MRFPEGIWYAYLACIPALAGAADKIIYLKKPLIVSSYNLTEKLKLIRAMRPYRFTCLCLKDETYTDNYVF